LRHGRRRVRGARHLKAILDTGNKLVAAVDPHDSVGVLDRFASTSGSSPKSTLIVTPEKLRRASEKSVSTT
jgi:UDP-N-acetyl-2-amino-2-deoxyglucuronate dehydrogenase